MTWTVPWGKKVDKLKSAMKSAMGKVKEKASRGAVKPYKGTDLQEFC